MYASLGRQISKPVLVWYGRLWRFLGLQLCYIPWIRPTKAWPGAWCSLCWGPAGTVILQSSVLIKRHWTPSHRRRMGDRLRGYLSLILACHSAVSKLCANFEIQVQGCSKCFLFSPFMGSDDTMSLWGLSSLADGL